MDLERGREGGGGVVKGSGFKVDGVAFWRRLWLWAWGLGWRVL